MSWAVVVYRDGEPMTGQVPCDDWTVAAATAEVFVGFLGGPISVASAVIANQPKRQKPLELFEDVA